VASDSYPEGVLSYLSLKSCEAGSLSLRPRRRDLRLLERPCDITVSSESEWERRSREPARRCSCGNSTLDSRSNWTRLLDREGVVEGGAVDFGLIILSVFQTPMLAKPQLQRRSTHKSVGSTPRRRHTRLLVSATDTSTLNLTIVARILKIGRSSCSNRIVATHISRIPATAPASAPAPAHATPSWGCVTRRCRVARVAFESVVRVRCTERGVAFAVRASCLVVRCVRALWWVVRGIVRWVRVVGAFVRRGSIRVCWVVCLVDWWRREVVATWVRRLWLIIADAVVWRRCVVAAVLVRGVRFAVVVFGTWIK
jgi:hypothetical protein